MDYISSTQAATIQEWLTCTTEFHLERYFGHIILGRAYVGIDSLDSISINGAVMKANFNGSKPYLLKIHLHNGQVQGECSCPYEGKCKHLASLLLYAIKK